MDTSAPVSGTKKVIAATVMMLALLGALLTATPADAAPSGGASTSPPDEWKTYLEYYEVGRTTHDTRYLNKTLHRLTDAIWAPDEPITVKKVSGVGYAAFKFDCGVQVTHTKGKKAHVYNVTIFTFGRLDQPAVNALDYPYAGRHADRHVLVIKTNVSPAGIDRALKSASKGCS